jgi:hydroxymethylpyrimidine kinase/phosphomethylpyrimidine kinase/thiamine-phosphate diphosphorylase
VGVFAVHVPPVEFLERQLEALLEDMPPAAVKIGMLGTEEHVRAVGSFLERLRQRQPSSSSAAAAPARVVLDPVMVSTSGHRLISEGAQRALVSHLLDRADVVTPNLREAEALLGGRRLGSFADVERAARDLIELGARAVLLKGGHALAEEEEGGGEEGAAAGRSFAQDYFLSSAPPPGSRGGGGKEPRLCDGSRGVWLRSTRYPTPHTHGTGCTLSSAMAGAAATLPRSADGDCWVDAACLAKAYVSKGIERAVGIGGGPGPVAHTGFPSSHEHFPRIVSDPAAPDPPPFRRMRAHGSPPPPDHRAGDEGGGPVPALGRILPIVDSAEWVERLCETEGVTDVQLRIKGEPSKERIDALVRRCQGLCAGAGVRLWVNDHWEAAVDAGCFGVHLGQEDLLRCLEAGGLGRLRESGAALGVSTHSYGELAAALGVRPTYVSLGPVFPTDSKDVGFAPQGLGAVAKWRELVPPDVPLVAIGGIGGPDAARQVRQAGADCAAVIGAVTRAADPAAAVEALNDAMTLDR